MKKPIIESTENKQKAQSYSVPSESSVPKVVKKQSTVTKIGVVVSTKMSKTVVVKVEKYQKHPLYKKQIKKTAQFKAHDDLGVKVGQKVKIVETRPISKDIHSKVLEVLK